MAGIGIFGGTFDPPHLGHERAARAAADALELDEVLWVVASDPYLREQAPTASGADRLAMVEAACDADPRFVASDLELTRGGPSYSVDTARALRASHPGARLVLIVGADLVAGLPSWHEAAELAQLVEVAVVPRPGSPAPSAPEGFATQLLPMEAVDLSSSVLREALASGATPAQGLAEGVVRVLTERHLYDSGL